MRKLWVAACAAACAVSLAACGSAEGEGDGNTLTVYAASSLTETFDKLKDRFQQQNEGVTVTVEYGGSSTLVQRITNAAGADVFASANEKNMDKLVTAGANAGEPQLFASNTLQIAVPPGNPKDIKGFADLAKPGVTTVVCAAQVPCGSATEKLEKATGVTLTPASEEPNVKSVLGKVQANEADAGLVYVTDVTAAGEKVDGVEFPEAQEAVNDYPIVAVQDGNTELAKRWIEFVRGETGRAELEKAGFEVP